MCAEDKILDDYVTGQPITARLIAAIVRVPTTTLEEAEEIIQSFANCRASDEVAKAIREQYARADAILAAPRMLS